MCGIEIFYREIPTKLGLEAIIYRIPEIPEQFSTNFILEALEFYHGTIKRTGTTCKKIPCYMRYSTHRCRIVKKLKYLEVVLNSF